MSAVHYMRLRRRAKIATDLCDKPGCKEPATWWGASMADGRVLMCDEHKSNHADEVLGS